MKKNILITGSTDGIGRLAAMKLAQEGHTLYLHGRSATKLAGVISDVLAQTQNKNLNPIVADFSDLADVKRMALDLNKEAEQLDVLINNAGVFKSAHPQTKAGWDLRIAVNYFAPYILTNALLPLLSKEESSRIINLSSAAQAPVSLEVLAGKKQGSDRETYAQSKLALTMWSFYLAKLVPDMEVIAVNPGSLLNTRMVQEAFGTHWAPADKGAKILYDLATLEKYKGMTGKYFDNDQGSFGQAHADAYNESKIKQLIAATEELLAD